VGLAAVYMKCMGETCCSPDPHRGSLAYRKALWAVLGINAVIFLVEIGAGLAALCLSAG
jgi:hypothetical protein